MYQSSVWAHLSLVSLLVLNLNCGSDDSKDESSPPSAAPSVSSTSSTVTDSTVTDTNTAQELGAERKRFTEQGTDSRSSAIISETSTNSETTTTQTDTTSATTLSQSPLGASNSVFTAHPNFSPKPEETEDPIIIPTFSKVETLIKKQFDQDKLNQTAMLSLLKLFDHINKEAKDFFPLVQSTIESILLKAEVFKDASSSVQTLSEFYTLHTLKACQDLTLKSPEVCVELLEEQLHQILKLTLWEKFLNYFSSDISGPVPEREIRA